MKRLFATIDTLVSGLKLALLCWVPIILTFL